MQTRQAINLQSREHGVQLFQGRKHITSLLVSACLFTSRAGRVCLFTPCTVDDAIIHFRI